MTALLTDGATAPDASDLAHRKSPDLGQPIGVTRHDASSDAVSDIAMSGRAQGLFAATDERRVVIVEHADALKDHSFIAEFPADAWLVLVTSSPAATRRRAPARAPRKSTAEAGPLDLTASVTAAGGQVERIDRLESGAASAWVTTRARLMGLELTPGAVSELAAAAIESDRVDADRVERELAKLGAYAGGKRIEADDVKALVAGAIESDVFKLTDAVVRKDSREAVRLLHGLLEGGQVPQQILALLLWQFRVLLFASAMRSNDDANRAAKAIRSSPGAILRWQAKARLLRRSDVTRAYEALYATDLAIKQGRTDEDTALLLCVLDLCGVANADPRELVVGEPPRR